MDNSFPEVKKYFGFGCMRLPMKGEEVDIEQFNKPRARSLPSLQVVR